jgi:glycosyltransferase involved in cell wall biosynthesis
MHSWIFFDAKENIHADRFVRALDELEFDVRFETYEHSSGSLGKFLFVAEIDKVPQEILESKSFLVGVSWAYDIERNLNSPYGLGLLRKVIERINLLIVDCQFYYEKVLSLGIESKKVLKMPYGVDLNFFEFQAKDFYLSDLPTFYSNRKWEAGYGHETILRAVELMVESGYKFRFILSNNGTLKKRLISHYDHLFQNGFIKDVGDVDEFQNSYFLRKSDYFVSASIKDGWSVSILEAMALGTPVIVTSIDQNSDLIIDGKTGISFSPESTSSLVEKMALAIEMLRNPKKLQEIAIAARRAIELKADYRQNIKHLVSCIQNEIAS